MTRLYTRLGGRKQANGYLFVLMATAAALPLRATFVEYTTAIGLVLLGTSASVAWEDIRRSGGKDGAEAGGVVA